MDDKKLIIGLVEDNINDAEKIKESFDETIDWLNKNGLMDKLALGVDSIEYIDIKGTDEVSEDGKEHCYFKDEDYDKVKEKIGKVINNGGSILMDILLTKTEQDQANLNKFDNIQFCKRFVEDDSLKDYIYIITSIRSIGSRMWSLFHRDEMLERYVQKDLVIGIGKSRRSISRVLYWLKYRSQADEKVLDEIEKVETGWYDDYEVINVDGKA